MSDQTGIVWKRFPGLPMADGRPASGDRSAPDYSRFGVRFQRETFIPDPFTAFAVYEMPDDLLRAPTPLELQLFEPPLYFPETPTLANRLSSSLGRFHARIFWTNGNSGPMRLDCDWCGSVPLVAHKSLNVALVADRFRALPESASFVETDFHFLNEDTDAGNPGTATLVFNVLLPDNVGDPITSPPTIAYLSRESISAVDAADFTSTQTNQHMILSVSWGDDGLVRFHVSSVTEHDDYLEIALSGLTQATTIQEDYADPVTVRLSFDDSPPQTRIDVAVGLIIGARSAALPPSYTYPATPLAADASATFPVPSFARKLRCFIKWGEADGSSPDAALGQYFVAFVSRGFGALAWIDAASAREALFGDGIGVPHGTHAITFSNRSADAISVMPSFVLGL